MASLVRKLLIVFAAVVSTIQLLCAMGLFSSIIIWISLEFTAALPSALAFVIGIPCLLCAVVFVLMFGIKERGVIFTVLYIILAVFIVIAAIAIMSPFIQFYNHERSDLIGVFCEDCDHLGRRTQRCVDECHDECCFTNFSAPLSRAFIAFTAFALTSGLASVIIGILNLVYIYFNSINRKKSH